MTLVITCRDSGGVLEFVSDEENGLVTAPEPAALAEHLIASGAIVPALRVLADAGSSVYAR